MKRYMIAFLTSIGALAACLLVPHTDASAYTRRVCGLAGQFNTPASVSFGNCSAQNTSGAASTIATYSIPIDNANSITGKTWVSSALIAPSTTFARLRTFQNTATTSTGTLAGCATCAGAEQYILNCAGAGCTVAAGGSVAIKVDIGANQNVYDVEITQ